MNEDNQNRINEFLVALGEALGPGGGKAGEICDEVRADLEAHVGRHRSAGLSEDQAVDRALDEMGNPYELAHHVRREVPPFGGGILATIRQVAASVLVLWLLVLLWGIRAGSYGLAGLGAGVLVLLLHLPLVLLLWPRIVWRRNWLFGLIPAGLALVVAIVLSVGGVEYSQELEFHVPLTEGGAATPLQPAVPPGAAPLDSPSGPGYPFPVLAAAIALAVVLLLAMQQRFQRRVVLLFALLVVALVETPFQVEELLFRQDRRQVRSFLDDAFRRTGHYPTTEEFKSHGPRLTSGQPAVDASSGQFSLLWSRPLSSGFSLRYLSDGDRVEVLD